MSPAILEESERSRNPKTVILSGGVGGARLARGFAAVIPSDSLTIIVNMGDDESVYGIHISPDLDTVVYTLAGIEGPEGWGISGDSFTVMDHLGSRGADTTFRLGDRDLATSLYRSEALAAGIRLSEVTRGIARSFGVRPVVLPATDDPVRTRIRIGSGDWLDFQEYFVHRKHRDEVAEVRFDGAETATPAPGVIDAIAAADLVVIGPSNPPLSIWPILAIPGIREAAEEATRVVGVSPLFGGRALKGPADRVMAGLGLPPGNAGVLAAYDGLLSDLVVDQEDRIDAIDLATGSIRVHVADTRIADVAAATKFTSWLLDRVGDAGGTP